MLISAVNTYISKHLTSESTTALTHKLKRIMVSSMLIVGASLLALSVPLGAYADSYDDRIRAIEQEVGAYQAQASDISSRADTLQNALDKIMAQKHALLARIELSQTKYDRLIADIAANEARLTGQKDLLGTTLTQLYVDGDLSTIEILAGSDSLGDFVDQQQYRSEIRSQLLAAMKKVKELEKQLETQKLDTSRALKELEAQRNEVASREAEQASLLEQTRGQEAAYQRIISGKNKEIDSLRSQQIAANSRFIGGPAGTGPACGGGYPGKWCDIPKDTVIDDWYMYNRECVSYTAYKVAQSGRYMPKNWYGKVGPNSWDNRGNAKYWPDNARADGIATGSTPRVGSVAISTAGPYGHSMYVEEVYGNGTILISQYNVELEGKYSTDTISASGLIYIYF